MSEKNPFSDPAFGAGGDTEQDNPFANPDFGKPASLARKVGDVGLSVAKGVIAVPEAAVGLADLATGGRAGKFLENEGGAVGFRPKQAKAVLSDMQSDEFKDKQRQFQQADGVVDKTITAVTNPSLIANAVAESVPSMLGGGVAARGLLAAAPRVGAVVAGAVGEGLVGAGSAAEQNRQETDDGLLTGDQAALAAGTGAATAGFGALGGRLQKALGIGDVDTMLAQGRVGAAADAAQASVAGAAGAASKVPAKSIPRQVVEGAIAEGWLEELPQSVAEQVLQNMALNKPWHEGVDDAAVMGTLAGMAMGGTAAGVAAGFEPRADRTDTTPPTAEADPLAKFDTNGLSLAPEDDGTGPQRPSMEPFTGGMANVQRTFDPRNPGSTPPLALVPQAEGGMAFDGAAGGAPDGSLTGRDPAELVGWEPFGPGAGSNGELLRGARGNPVRAAVQKAADAGGSLAAAAGLAMDSGAAPGLASPAVASPDADRMASTLAGSELARTSIEGLALPELQARLQQVQERARQNGSWNVPLMAQRRRLEEAIKAAPAQSVATEPAAQAPAQPQAQPAPAGRITGTDIAGSLQGGNPLMDAARTTASVSLTGTRAGDLLGQPDNAQYGQAARANERAQQPRGVLAKLQQQREAANVQNAAPAQSGQAQAAPAQAAAPAAGGSQVSAAEVPAAGTGPLEAAGVGGTKAITAKQIPDMTDDELQQAIAHYGSAHKRTAKLQAALQKRAGAIPLQPPATPVAPQPKGAANGTEAPQAQQAETQGSSAPAAAADVSAAANEAATSQANDLPQPTEAQKAAGNYKKGHVQFDGLDLTIENPVGSERSGTDPGGKPWSVGMTAHYGYLKRSEGADGDQVDVYLAEQPQAGAPVFVFDQYHADGSFDEHKAVVGVASEAEAAAIYDAHFSDGTGPQRRRAVTRMSVDEFKAWARSNEAMKPAANPETDQGGKAVEGMEFGVPPAAAPAPQVSANTIFTEDAAAAARALLKRKLGQLSSGIDPEILQAGITLAGYHIEKGARTFAAYAKAMVADLGDGVKPYLKSWYMGVKYDPRAASFDGMDSAAAVEAFDLEASADAKAADAVPAAEAKQPLPVPEEDFARLMDQAQAGQDAKSPFMAPDKTTRAEDVAKAGGTIDQADADARIEQWRAHARAQGKNGANAGKTIVSLFDASGEWSKPWREAGYDVYQFDVQDGTDINDFSVEYLTEELGLPPDVYAILAAPPCTDFSSSGAHAWKKKDADGRTAASVELVRQTLRTVEFFKPVVWAMENPVGRIAKLASLPAPRLTFQPANYGNAYTKRTLLWGDFNEGLPQANVEPVNGSKITEKLSSTDKYGRSLTPEGFAYAFFMANNAQDMVPAERLAREFRGIDRATIEQALQAGMSEAQIRSTVEDDWNDGMLDDANTALVAQLDKPSGAADTGISENDENAQSALGQPDPQALDDVSAQEGSGTSRAGVAGSGSADGRQPGGAADPGADAERLPAARSRGSRTRRVSDPAARAAGRGRPRAGRAQGAGAGVPAANARPGVTEQDGAEQTAETASAPNIPALNFRIDDSLSLGEGGEAVKFRDNIAAIKTLKAIEAEQRRATPEEQRILARFVGWGGLASAFPNPETGKFKPDWQQRGEELRELLTPSELRAASRSTRNAHYTSETVVSAMWDAVRRLGYRNGLALESSMGSGNFLGLMPSSLVARFIGVEYDSLTARIAGALYPQATVLHSGFQDVPLPDKSFDLAIGNPPFGDESLRFQFKPELRGVSIHNQFFRASMDALKPGGLMAQVVSRYLMDAQDKSTRIALARQADLVAGFRLPDTAFKENARTEVVTDILIFQKRQPADEARMEAILDAHASPKEKAADKERERQALAAQAPAWIETANVPDPLGGEPMTVNRYFAENKGHIIGTMDRSGSMRYKNDLTVHLDDPKTLGDRLADLVAKLPQDIVRPADDVAERTEQAHKLLGDALRIAVAKEEAGHLKFDEDRKLTRVVEREYGSDTVLQRQPITANSPWSTQLLMDDQGRWYKVEVKMDDRGNPVKKLGKDGRATKLNDYERVVYASEADIPASMRLGESGFERLEKLVGLRDLLKRQLVLETEDAPKVIMELNRGKLAKSYAAFVQKHGPINRRANAALVSEMPDAGIVLAIESAYEPARTAEQARKSGLPQQDESVTPAPILRERVVPKYEPPTKAETPADALAITLAERGAVDIEHIAKLLGASPEAAEAALRDGDKPLIFKDPETSTFETANAYLSGQVKRKLMAAKAAGLQQNVKALEAVQPARWGAENVAVQLGATWVPADVYAGFAEHMMGGKARASFSALTNTFTISLEGAERNKADQWGTEDMSGIAILGKLLNSQSPIVMRTDGEGKSYVDKEATSLAMLKGREIVAEFGDWIFKDGDRRERLVEIFNEKFNTRVTRQFDGSHLKLPGKVPDQIIRMRRHQMNAIWRGISSSSMLIDHVVGAGKTFTAIARAMERRRMGLAQKPTIVVPNHLVEQWQADVYRLYPAAKVLAATKKDFEKKNRRKLLGRVATGDYDIVIMPHSSFGFIGIAPETEQRYLEEELNAAIQAVKEAQEQAEDEGYTGFRKPLGVKEAERLVAKIEARMAKLREGARDRLLTFEQLGIDDLTIDEAHEFKNLFYSSRVTKTRGMGNKVGSRKAADLYNKVRVLRDNGGAVTFMTGTPVSNSVVELYTMMRYLASNELRDLGMEHFDAWRTQFVDAAPAFEPNEAGRLQEVTRLGRTWSNMRSLMDLYYGFTDAVTIEDIKQWYAEDNAGKQFPVPKVKGGDRSLVKVSPTPAQESLLKEVIAGFDGLDGIKDIQERNAERLRLMDRARKLSLDIRAVYPMATSKEEGGKLEQLSNEVKRIYDRWSADKGTQLVFLDRSVPKSAGDAKVIKEYEALVARRDKALAEDDDETFQEVGEALEKYDANEIEALRNAQAGGWTAYQQIKDNLVAMGIPAAEVRFVQEANNDEQKQALFDAVNGGKVRVLIGSTPRMGAGTNVQKRLVALHHADVTWKPSDIEQREGRIIRQGNELLEQYGDQFEVEILAYATERTVDAKMWSLNATKLRAINGLRKYTGDFTMELEDEESVSMAEMAALASGNPLLLERVTLESAINNLELQERAHRRKLYGAEDALQRARRIVATYPAQIAEVKALAASLAKPVQDLADKAAARRVNVEGAEFDSYKEALRAAQGAVATQQAGNENARYAISVDGQRLTSKGAYDDAIMAALGDDSPFEVVVDGKTYTQRTAAGRDTAKLLSAKAQDGIRQTASGDLGSMFGMPLKYQFSPNRWEQGKVDLLVFLERDGKLVASGEFNAHDPFIQYTTAQLRDVLGKVAGEVEERATGGSVDYMEGSLERARRDIPTLEPRVNEPFPKAQDLKEKRARLQEVVTALTVGAPQAADQASEEDAGDAGDAVLLSRRPGAGSGLTRQASDARLVAIQQHIDAITDNWANAPEVIVARNMQDALVPKEVRDYDAMLKSQGATGAPRGFYHRGKAYLLSDNIASRRFAETVLFHEVLGHYGLRGTFGPALNPILQQLATMRRTDVAAKAKEYGLNMAIEGERLQAAEEVLAEMAQKHPEHGFVKRAIAAIRQWLRQHVPGFSKLALTDDDIIANYILPARGFVERGRKASQRGAMPAFQREEADQAAPAGEVDTDVRFSRADGVADRLGQTIKAVTATKLKQKAGYKMTDLLGLGLQGLGRRQLVDVYGGLLPLDDYNRLVAQMEADKNEGGAEADKLVTRWSTLTDELKLAELMHDATLAQIDPDKPYVNGDDKAKYQMLRGRFGALSDEAKTLYRDARDSYRAHHEKVRQAIKDRILRSEIRGERKAALLAQMDSEFFKAVKGVYFPLARFGQYVVAVKGPGGKVESVGRAETMAEAQELRKNLLAGFQAAKGYAVGRVMLSKEFIADRDAVGRGFMTELYHALDKQDLDVGQRAELEDTLGQLYLSSMPDLSWAKHGIHRKGTPGFSQDARRAFAQNMFHGARYLAKLRYSDLMTDELARMQKHVDDWREVSEFDQPKAQRVVDEFNKRHETLMNPKSNPLSTALTSFGFIFHLGLSPASALVNLSQTALVAYPVMGAKWGFDKAGAALLAASGQAAQGKNDIRGALSDEEKSAYDEAVRSGVIDVTMAHDLAGIAQGEDTGVMWRIRPVMKWASFLFHHAERFNRQVTFVAAYRLAREAGADKKAAFDQAAKATYDGHFDYGAANRPRVMQGNAAKVLLLFKQYGQNMVYTLSRQAYLAVKAGTPEQRAEARRALGGLLVSHAMAAGVLGLPLVTTLLAAASMLGGDDDEPWDAKVALQNMLADTFGQKPAEVMSHGLSRLTPWDISGRVGLDKLILPDIQEGLEGQRLAESAMAAALGPVAGIAVNALKGLQDMGDGHYARGLEAMMPAALRGPVKAIRYANEGAQDKTGVSIVDEVNPAGVLGQALGFSPSQVRNATDGKSAVLSADRALNERRQELLGQFARAAMAQEQDGMAEARQEIASFNEKHPGRRIQANHLMASVRNRQRRVHQAQDGVYLPRNHRDVMDVGRFATAD